MNRRQKAAEERREARHEAKVYNPTPEEIREGCRQARLARDANWMDNSDDSNKQG